MNYSTYLHHVHPPPSTTTVLIFMMTIECIFSFVNIAYLSSTIYVFPIVVDAPIILVLWHCLLPPLPSGLLILCFVVVVVDVCVCVYCMCCVVRDVTLFICFILI